jgi:hypothetical protein
MSADGGLLFNEVDAESLIGQIEAGLHSGNAAANDHDGPYWSVVVCGVCTVKGVCLRTVSTHGAPLPWLGACILGFRPK